jgi:U4/U6 small nuclear ribonucleoprotein PRP31
MEGVPHHSFQRSGGVAASTLADALLDDLDDLSDRESDDDDLDEDLGDDLGVDEHKQERSEGQEGATASADESTTTHNNLNRRTPSLLSAPAADAATGLGTGRARFRHHHHHHHHRLLEEPLLRQHLTEIRALNESTRKRKQGADIPNNDKNSGNSSGSDDSRLIIESNRQLGRISEEVVRAHGELAAAYRPRFPELEEIVAHPEHYLRVVQIVDLLSAADAAADVGDADAAPSADVDDHDSGVLDLARHNDALNEFLTPHQVLTLSVAASSTSGRALTADERRAVAEAASYLQQVIAAQSEIQEFVSARLTALAPNGCALVGPDVMAHMIGLAGGSLDELSKIPACNLQIVGQNHAGQPSSTAASRRTHEGVLASCDLVQQLPRALQHKALKVVAAKLALAIRCDLVASASSSSSRQGNVGDSNDQHGRTFRQQCQETFHKWQEPDRAPVLKALPK